MDWQTSSILESRFLALSFKGVNMNLVSIPPQNNITHKLPTLSLDGTDSIPSSKETIF